MRGRSQPKDPRGKQTLIILVFRYTAAYTFSIVPPTPQDLVLTRPMISPVYGQFNSPTAWGSLMSPSPLATGIMASVEKSNQQAAALRLRSRSPSVESRSSHRHSPYSHSRKSSGASASSVLLEHTYNTTAGVGESVNISQLGSINPAFLRPTGGSGRNSDASDHGSDYHYNAFPQLEESDDSDDSDDEDAVAAAKGPSQRTPAIRAVTQSSTSRLPTPARSETASNAGDEEWQATSKRTSKQKRRPAVLIEDPPQVKLVTAITASGKKSHARKVSPAACTAFQARALNSRLNPCSGLKIIFLDRVTRLSSSANMW